ncbi:histidine--tRNA ligase [Helicobacter enhydrae]|uniref:Histidine--tRNA ligase n=1 Tax=Helicobacter enhydrae TaxID=222136 RepID=A0A1B1U724_9HELI|nr:histidine--tRNA ligase [Helicobacter enhydrae]ANV98485.1 histidine--tRNA ligase [Helicobacter enhydrae]
MIQAKTLSGFKDRLPSEALLKRKIINQIIEVFDSFGFTPIETPHLEYADILVKQGSDEIQKELYAFRDHGGRDVALRFDLTVPLARFVSQHKQELDFPFRRYAIGNVFRGERAQKGRYREFTQCDFDLVGSESIASDSEVIQVIIAIMHKLNVGGFCLKINHRGVLNGICEYLGIDKIHAVLRIIDKLDKIGQDGVRQELEGELSEEQVCSLLELITLKEERGERGFLDKVSKLKSYNETLQKSLQELDELYAILEKVGLPKESYCIDFSIARGLGYYTGIVYECVLDLLPSIGSVCSGGRYDNLVQTFAKDKLSGVGASVGLDRLLSALSELGKVEQKSTQTQILCIAMDKEAMPFVYQQAHKLRNSGIGVEVYPEIVRLKKSLTYADRKGHQFALIVGEEEMKCGKVTLKNLKSGEQDTMIDLEICQNKCLGCLDE